MDYISYSSEYIISAERATVCTRSFELRLRIDNILPKITIWLVAVRKCSAGNKEKHKVIYDAKGHK